MFCQPLLGCCFEECARFLYTSCPLIWGWSLALGKEAWWDLGRGTTFPIKYLHGIFLCVKWIDSSLNMYLKSVSTLLWSSENPGYSVDVFLCYILLCFFFFFLNSKQQQPLRPILVETSCPNIRMDPKLCPADPNWIAFIHCNDIWISNIESREERRLTFVHNGNASWIKFLYLLCTCSC